MNKNVYRVDVEVGPMEGTQLPEEAEGAFVSVYIGADSIRQAIDAVEQRLLLDRYQPIETTAAFQLDPDEDGSDIGDDEPDSDDLRSLQRSGGTWYGSFNWWYPERKHAH